MKRAARIVSGFTLVLAGLAMLVLPGPGWVTIALGLALLAPDYQWAERSLAHIRAAGHRGAEAGRAWWRHLRTGSSAADDKPPR